MARARRTPNRTRAGAIWTAALRKHVEDNMLPKCDAKDPEGSGCDDQEIAYVAKMIAKGGEAVEKELARLEGMGSAMKADKNHGLRGGPHPQGHVGAGALRFPTRRRRG